MSANASELFREMLAAVQTNRWRRKSEDPSSPMQEETLEASFGYSFTLHSCEHNLIDCRSTDMRWAIANLLHFFAATEEAEMLPRYNARAAKFLNNSKFEGAYGAIAMPQIEKCINVLRDRPRSRRAIVSMGGLEHDDVNRPACWSFLHFMTCREGLSMVVYQRSLNLTGVMPYDCIVLTNVLRYVAHFVGIKPGFIRWVVGSLHTRVEEKVLTADGFRHHSIAIDPVFLSQPSACLAVLREPETWSYSPYNAILASPTEVRSC